MIKRTKFPCGCVMAMSDSGVAELQPCRNDCPIVDASKAAALKEGAEIISCPKCASLPCGVSCSDHPERFN